LTVFLDSSALVKRYFPEPGGDVVAAPPDEELVRSALDRVAELRRYGWFLFV
jgi:hypothetical protein